MSINNLFNEEFSSSYLEIEGNQSLNGLLRVSGAKNSVLVLMAASLLTDQPMEIKNAPRIKDIEIMSNILSCIGLSINRKDDTLTITPPKRLEGHKLPEQLVRKLRASFVCIGPLLTRIGKAEIPLPGGCKIGARPVDEHIKGLKALGANIKIHNDSIIASLKNDQAQLQGASIALACPSVGATETILMAATLAKGTTIISNAAQEPEIADLAEMLNSMGANINGAGSSLITIQGVKALEGCSYTAMPDRIEAGSFLIAGAITRSNLLVGPVIKEHLTAVIDKLISCGCKIISEGDFLRISAQEIHGINISTSPYPGFPTDLQAPFMALLATAKGKSEIKESIFENRMQHVAQFREMGAMIELVDNSAVITGVPHLKGSVLKAGDLRASAALLLACLAAEGQSKLGGLNHLDRGYEDIETKINDAGGYILRKESSANLKGNPHSLGSTCNLNSNLDAA